MNGKSKLRWLVYTVGIFAKIFCVFSLFIIAGCDAQKYNVILAIDAKEYRTPMKWAEIRETGFKDKIHGLRVYDSDGKPISLYRYQHESREIMLLDETEIAISTPIIIERKNGLFFLALIVDHNEVARIRVKVDELKPVRDRPEAHVLPLGLPSP